MPTNTTLSMRHDRGELTRQTIFSSRCSTMLGAIIVAIVGWIFLEPIAYSEESSRQPNVVVILADDLGYGDLGCYGHPRYKTPRLDRMAAEGARMTQFNTPMPYCAPTRAALLTGRYPLRCGMIGNPTPDGGPRWDNFALPKDEQTLAQLLKQNGYATSLVGKWHLGHKAGTLPTDRGFDEYYGIPYSNDMRPVQVLEGTKVVESPVTQTTLTERYTRRAVDFIQRHRARPFFLYFAMVMPHKPLAASDEFYKKSGAGLYGDVIAELDASVGRVLDALKECGIDDKTLVLFSSDNGPWFGGSSGGLRGMKAASWEGGYRVPFIARWPGRINAGRVSHELAATMDIFSTVLAATATRPPHGVTLDGHDLLATFNGAKSPREFVAEHHGDKLVAIRDARWKLHVLAAREMNFKTDANGRWTDPRGPDGTTILAPLEQYNVDTRPGVLSGVQPTVMQLFDLQKDPGEQVDVATANPGETRRLKAAFDALEADLKQARTE